MKVEIGPYPEGDEEREVYIQIDDYDTWSAYETIALVAAPLLRRLKETKQGSPPVDIEDVPAAIREDCGEDGGIHVRWTYVLDEMIWALENLNTTPDIDIEWEEGPHHLSDTPCGTHTTWDLRPKDPTVWERYMEEKEHIENRVSNGLRLFGKYFQSLWD